MVALTALVGLASTQGHADASQLARCVAGMFCAQLLIGWSNDYGHAGAENPGGYNLGMWIFSILGFLGVLFAFLLRQREIGPYGHGLETITTAKAAA